MSNVKRITTGLVLAVALFACGRKAGYDAPEYKAAADAAKSGFVVPLQDDSSADIMSWVDGAPVTDWNAEIQKRDHAIEGYLNDADPGRAEKYGFCSGQNPKLAWEWFNNNPVGFNGVPYVLLKTIFDLDPNDRNPALRAIARIWKRQATVPDASGGEAWTMDHIGISPRPNDYDNGVARPAGPAALPYGFAFENPQSFAPLDAVQRVTVDTRLGARELAQKAFLLAAKLKTVDHEDNWEKDRPGFGTPGSMDRVFFSCAACHVGRVMVNGRMKFLPGMPNTQIEAQYYSKLLMLTGAALVKSGFDVTSRTPVNPNNIEVNRDGVQALYGAMIDKALHHPETLYGNSPEAIARGKLQTLAVANAFPDVMKDLVAVAVKTHFIYYVVAKNNAYKAALPDVLEDRPGQMDAFGIASGLVAIHTRRPDNSYMQFIQRDNPKSPFFTGFSKANGMPVDTPGMTAAVTDPKAARASAEERLRLGAAGARARGCEECELGETALPRQLGWQPGRLVTDAGVRGFGDRGPADGQRPYSRAVESVHQQSAAAAVSLRERRSRAGEGRQSDLHAGVRVLPQAEQRDHLCREKPRRRSEPDDGQHGRLAVRIDGAGDGSVHDLRVEQPGKARRAVVHATGRLERAAGGILPRHAAAGGRRHQRVQGGHAVRNLGAGAISAQRIGADDRSADVSVNAAGEVSARKSQLR
ncbi:MAG: hypothetical protein DMF88_21870 [Acidobacteria bacterium]|nr:MAG: hypothetical protein DMF88_21870 [Acidobacteriota bacterium]